jgi:hypothetical protein
MGKSAIVSVFVPGKLMMTRAYRDNKILAPAFAPNYTAPSFNLGPETAGGTGTIVTAPPLANGPFLMSRRRTDDRRWPAREPRQDSREVA